MLKSLIIYMFVDCGVFLLFRKWLKKPRTWKSKNYRIHQTSLIYVLWGRSVFYVFRGWLERPRLWKCKNQKIQKCCRIHIFSGARGTTIMRFQVQGGSIVESFWQFYASILIHRCSPHSFLHTRVRPKAISYVNLRAMTLLWAILCANLR